MPRKVLALVATMAAAVLLTGCVQNKQDADQVAAAKVQHHAAARSPYLPKNDVEFHNYNAAQQLYDSPTTIIWCSTTWGNASAPIVTVPVAGKLTSSSVSYFPSTLAMTGDGSSNYEFNPERRSVDGMYHGSPPPYRYGFTPGGQYVDFFNMPTLCTTQPTKFQRQKTDVVVSIDQGLSDAQARASALLREGKKDQAQKVLEAALGGN